MSTSTDAKLLLHAAQDYYLAIEYLKLNDTTVKGRATALAVRGNFERAMRNNELRICEVAAMAIVASGGLSVRHSNLNMDPQDLG